jgi:hypothetical protein
MNDFDDLPEWIVYRIIGQPFSLIATTKPVWDSMMEHPRTIERVEVIAEDLTYETARKMIALTKGEQYE